jgi:hypothetical protein
MDGKVGSWSWLLTKGRDQENYPSRLLVTSVKTPYVVPSTKTIYIRDIMSVVYDKENQSEMSMDDWSSRKLDGLGKEKKVGSKWHLFSSLFAHLCYNAHHCE